MKDMQQIIVFKLGGEQYGFPIEQVSEIIRYAEPSKVPNSSDFLKGVISLRGKIKAIIDLRTFFEMEEKQADENTKIIIANDTNAGFIVDDVVMIITLKTDEVEDKEKLPMYINQNYVLNLIKLNGNVIIILDMPKIFEITTEEKEVS